MSSSPVDPRPALDLPKRIIEADASKFSENFNRSSFMFSHNLAGHPLFEVPRLAELSNTLLSKGGTEKVIRLGGKVPVHAKWGDMVQKEQVQKQVAEVIASIEESDSYISLKSVQLDPEYYALLNQIVAELEDLTGTLLHQEITWLESYIFIASPHLVTPYHFDHESNFLFQIHGEKNVNLFDQCDRSVLTEQEIERYYIGDEGSANYKEENQNKASVYHLIPGKAVHHPVRAPHWVRNGNKYSVSLSINFYMRSFDLQARIYQVNHFLRKLGLEPTPPGRSPLKDRAKLFAMGMLSKRKPETKYQVVYSGISRIKALIKFVQPVVRLRG